MGNVFGSKKSVKIMKIDGEMMKVKSPVKAGEVLKDHPGLVLLDSEAVKHYGVRAKAIEAHKELQPKRLYFLVELPKEIKPRRVRSGIVMSAKDRLDNLVLTRRSASDLSIMKQSKMDDGNDGGGGSGGGGGGGGGVRLKVRLPKAEVEKLMRECKDEAEAAEMIMRLYKANGSRENKISEVNEKIKTPRQKRVSFMPSNEGGIQVAVAS
ncbi:uncharacterized protein At1g66480-like [Vicia villosa]|uniref:uncharacterized protein At1g66480-like n=1 Tax=Vicia villosa TaxID=3911 RepID=UPI00273C0B53|nr:uncharacterized protein At1g66480-like [Vicia villosa]